VAASPCNLGVNPDGSCHRDEEKALAPALLLLMVLRRTSSKVAASSDLRPHFGPDSIKKIDSIEIDWPSGLKQILAVTSFLAFNPHAHRWTF
jgi:hypothetical protein